MTGGSGVDKFYLAGGDVVTDFTAAASGDIIDISNTGNATYSAAGNALGAVISEGSTADVAWTDGDILRVSVATRAELDTQTEIVAMFQSSHEFDAVAANGDEATLLIFAVDTGKVYVYDRDGILLKVKVYKNGVYHSDGQL